MARYVGHLVGWVEVKRVLSLRALPKPIVARVQDDGFRKKQRVKNALFFALPILHSTYIDTIAAFGGVCLPPCIFHQEKARCARNHA